MYSLSEVCEFLVVWSPAYHTHVHAYL